MILILVTIRCSSAPINSGGFEGNHRFLKRIIVVPNLQVRRPPSEGADPGATPGGEDYSSHPPVDEKFDCAAPRSIFKDVALDRLRNCIASLNAAEENHPTQLSVVYRVKREAVPTMELDNPDGAPECLRDTLPRIAMPREIVFQSNDEGKLLCYSSRFDVEADQVMSLKVPLIKKMSVRLDFPIKKPPLKDDETILLLTSWAISPLWDPDTKRIDARIMPDRICATCMGEKNMLTPDGAPPVLWP